MTLHAGALSRSQAQAVEWPTLTMIGACYGLWAAVGVFLYPISPVLTILLLGVLIAFHGSLTHEVLHGHPFRSKALNEAMMFTSLNLCIPYNRFRDLHLAHHPGAPYRSGTFHTIRVAGRACRRSSCLVGLGVTCTRCGDGVGLGAFCH